MDLIPKTLAQDRLEACALRYPQLPQAIKRIACSLCLRQQQNATLTTAGYKAQAENVSARSRPSGKILLLLLEVGDCWLGQGLQSEQPHCYGGHLTAKRRSVSLLVQPRQIAKQRNRSISPFRDWKLRSPRLSNGCCPPPRATPSTCPRIGNRNPSKKPGLRTSACVALNPS